MEKCYKIFGRSQKKKYPNLSRHIRKIPKKHLRRISTESVTGSKKPSNKKPPSAFWLISLINWLIEFHLRKRNGAREKVYCDGAKAIFEGN